jgi:hypothetical protein
MDVLNVFNWDNFVNQSSAFSPNGMVAGHYYNQTGNIANSMRTLRLSIGGKF